MMRSLPPLPALLSLSLILGLVLSCEEDPKESETKASVSIQSELKVEDQTIARKDTVDLSNGYSFTLKKFKLYLSRIEFQKANGERETLKKIALIDPGDAETGLIQGQLPEGEYSSINLGIGVDPEQNDADPTTFPQEHPLSSYQQTYWSMLKYRFAIIEGRSNDLGQLGSSDDILNAYHPGTDPLYKTKIFPMELSLSGNEEVKLLLTVDLNTLFDGPRPLDFRNEPQTHSDEATIEIAQKIMENLEVALELQAL